VVLLATGNKNKERTLDERVTLSRYDKIPYGTYTAYRNLKHIFPGASISVSNDEPGYWDSISMTDSKQVFLVVCYRFSPDEAEIQKMITFTENGNDVFISAMIISDAAERMIQCSTTGSMLPSYFGEDLVGPEDSMKVKLNAPPFEMALEYSYPGKPYGSVFTKINEQTTNVLGTGDGLTNFIHLRAGKGNIYMHLSPLAFSNYFILHKDNIDYYEKALSVIKPDVNKVVWDEYYLNKRTAENKPKSKLGWLTVLFRFPGLRAALLTAIFTLLLYVLLEMRRKQRIIPVITKPRNDSLDFVKTIGRLYYDKGDHKNL
jgi:hypothetical protein